MPSTGESLTFQAGALKLYKTKGHCGKIRAGVNNLKLAVFGLMFPLLRHNCLFDKGRLTVSQLLLQLSNRCLKSHWNKIRQTELANFKETFYQLPLCFYEQLWPIYLYINDGDVPTVWWLVPSVLHYWHWCRRFQSWAFQHVASGFGELHWAHLSPSAASSSSLQYDFTKHKIHEGKFALAVCLCWFPQYKCVFVWDKWLTFVTSLRALQVCSSPLSSAPFATSWSLFLNVRWPVEHPVCGPREESKSKILKKRRRRSMNHHCFDFIPFPSVADSISQLQLQTSQLSVSVLCWLSSELLCPVMPSQSKRRCSLLDHQSPSFAQSVFSPKSDKGQHTHKNIV